MRNLRRWWGKLNNVFKKLWLRSIKIVLKELLKLVLIRGGFTNSIE